MTSLPTLGLLALWLGVGLRRAYGESRPSATLKAVALAVAFGFVLFAYRALLFFVTFWTT